MVNGIKGFGEVDHRREIRRRGDALGLAGGGTDVSPYCDQYGGNVLNATIDRYAYATVRTLDTPVVRFVASDQPATVELPLDARYPLDGPLALHRAVYNHMVAEYLGGK